MIDVKELKEEELQKVVGGTLDKELEKKIVGIIKDKLNLSSTSIDPNTKIKADLGADSLEMVDIVQSLEQEFKITIDDENFYQFVKIVDIINCISNKLA